MHLNSIYSSAVVPVTPLLPGQKGGGDHVALLSEQSDYKGCVGQVVSVFESHLVVLQGRKKDQALLVQISLSECRAVRYSQRMAVLPMVWGFFLVSFILWMLYLLRFDADFLNGNSVVIYPFLIGSVFISGWRKFTGPRRHRLEFVVGDRSYGWESLAGDFEVKKAAMRKVRSFAQAHGWWVEVH